MPDAKETVVSNTTPIIALSLVGQHELLQQLYGEVLLPPAVYREVMVGGRSKIGVTELQNAVWLRQVALTDPRRADLLVDLDTGEAEAIALAQERNADLLLLDERLGRRYARRAGIPITGTLGVLLRAKQEGMIPQIRPLVEQMQKGGIRLGGELVANVYRLANEL
jgi:predicted nucleic acid-binding protein